MAEIIENSYTATTFQTNLKEDGMTLLHHAVADMNYDAVKEMTKVSFFRDIANACSEQTGVTPLMCISPSSSNEIKIFDLLLQNGANLTAITKEGGLSCLHLASMQGNVRLVDHIIKLTKQIDPMFSVNSRFANNTHTTVSIACNMGHIDTVNLLLENEADLMYLNAHGLNAMDTIVGSDNLDLLRCVYEKHYRKYRKDLK
eukprot:CAMPEP_0116871858 /NCGR_PEP_ID=MMETSP0463-20121206/2383_1 /TAXON_ID=181622 /ORGANISM="Strombidinopsis sp, Strain SopsisLIS2011" /LENGTH=200 /DNA_ID=CAMNT_0004511049 /DNA_START=17 /DNA_END=619 /DNA_ORIENTATION=+